MFEIPGEVYDSDADEDPINPADLLSNDDNDAEETTVLEVEPIIEVANIKEENIEAENIVEELEEEPPPETKPTLSIKPITRSGHYFKSYNSIKLLTKNTTHPLSRFYAETMQRRPQHPIIILFPYKIGII